MRPDIIIIDDKIFASIEEAQAYLENYIGSPVVGDIENDPAMTTRDGEDSEWESGTGTDA